MVDLHSHSTASDGDLAPAELVARAAARGVRVLALTDHDTMAGVPEAQAAADARGVRLIPAVELSVKVSGGSMHLLAYFTEAAPEPLTGRMAELARGRRERAARILERLADLGAPITMEDVLEHARGNIGRPHIADALVARGYASSRVQAFDRYLSDRGPAYVGYQTLGPVDAVRMVRASGGAAVLAHPQSLRLGERDLRAFVQRLAAAGLAGIEVHRPDHDGPQRREYGRLARSLRLVPCGGSDFHRPGEGLEPGDTGDPPLPEGTADLLLHGVDALA